MNLTDIEIDQIIKNNCGSPPEVEKLKYSIWLNTWKYDDYSKTRRYSIHRSDKEYNDNLDSYKRLLNKLQEVLRSVQQPDGQLVITM
jgi:preprotein translocase subunit SecA